MPERVLYMVRARIAPEREAEWNQWFDAVHLPAMLKFPGVVAGRRYRTLDGDPEWPYVTCLEFESEKAYRAYMESGYLRDLIRDYDARFGADSPRVRSAYLERRS